MIYKLRTSKDTQKIFSKVGTANGLQPFALAKIAIALSIRHGALREEDFLTDSDGQELNRQTIFGENELMYRCLIVSSENRIITEAEFFPRLVKAHMDRGARLLGAEARYSKNIYQSLCQLEASL